VTIFVRAYYRNPNNDLYIFTYRECKDNYLSEDLHNKTLDDFIQQKTKPATHTMKSQTVTVDLNYLRQKLSNRDKYSENTEEKVIGKVVANAGKDSDVFCFVLIRDADIYGVRSYGLMERVLYYRLLETYSVPRKELLDPVPFSQRWAEVMNRI